jgi:aspartate aminotransferase
LIDINLDILESLEKLVTLFREDNDPRKTDLLVGVYKTDEGKAYVQPSVKEV